MNDLGGVFFCWIPGKESEVKHYVALDHEDAAKTFCRNKDIVGEVFVRENAESKIVKFKSIKSNNIISVYEY